MKTYSKTVSNKLNDLLEKTHDAEKGFQKAANNVENKALRNYFNRKSNERKKFAHELEHELTSFGQSIDKSGSMKGAAHRLWMDTKAILSLDNEESMLEEAIRGEKASLEEYEEVIAETSLPTSTKNMLESQKKTIKTGLSEIKILEDLH